MDQVNSPPAGELNPLIVNHFNQRQMVDIDLKIFQDTLVHCFLASAFTLFHLLGPIGTNLSTHCPQLPTVLLTSSSEKQILLKEPLRIPLEVPLNWFISQTKPLIHIRATGIRWHLIFIALHGLKTLDQKDLHGS